MLYILPLLLLAGAALYFFVFRAPDPRTTTHPESWHKLLLDHVVFYKELSAIAQKRFRNRMMLFLEETYVEAVGFELEELDTVLVAASAVIPVFKFKEWHYENLTGVVLYPDNFNEDMNFDQEHPDRMIGGMVGNGRYENQMILSRSSLHHGFENNSDKHNTGIHEFVHLIDKVDGETDGVPERLLEKSYVLPWINLMHKEMESIDSNKSDIRKYGGTNQAEFFAVAAEYFFSRPKLMKRKHPELYKMLLMCFDPRKKPKAA
ncbi:phenylalanyl-tRNA synthetase [Nonlabens sp. YIK11]|uniref:M90 family metallopeptidase n=1 Tax=Nonlabens sp. YIK11 TaxID=1453349 RepID=UPI0006DCA90C|nr:M90 family metallopeptidase [Nonlabens sp. YIK11]KQC33479.1 phenylalanyl-tRNA synthetase [Nonlabens sp. YIK11]